MTDWPHTSDPGQHVLDLGCGTGAMALRAARRGATVKGIDVNPQMLEIAEQRARDVGLTDSISLVESGVADLDEEDAESYDIVTSTLCFSELGEDELAYTLEHVVRILKPDGLVLVAEEVVPRSLVGRWAHRFVRAPLVALTYLIAQQTTHPVARLSERLTQAGLSILSVRSGMLGSFSEIVACKPTGAST